MDDRLIEVLRSIRNEFDVESVYVFGSHGRGEATPESDVDILVVCSQVPDDPFELIYAIRHHLHERLDLAIDVILTSRERFAIRHGQSWTMEYIAFTEGIAV
jgi:predicted nucleotidyltransferase